MLAEPSPESPPPRGLRRFLAEVLAMRISVDESDTGYHHAAHLCRIWLEGAERSNVVTADEEHRFAVTLRRNEFGEPVLDKAGQPLTDNFYGAVRIECPAWIELQQGLGHSDI
jgi:hypothetical protein